MFTMFVIILTCVVAGLINPYFKVIFATQSFFMLSLGGLVNGYISARMMRFFGAKKWRLAATMASFILPLFIFTIFSLVDIIEWFEASSAYQPLTSVIGLTLLWIAFTAPIAYLGAY